MDYPLAITKNEVLICATMYTDLENIMQSERSKSQIIPFVWNVQGKKGGALDSIFKAFSPLHLYNYINDLHVTVHFHVLEKEMASHSSVLAWRIPGTVEPVGLPSMGSHRVGHDWSDLAAAAAAVHF